MRTRKETPLDPRPSSGYLPAWTASDIPEPPPPTLRNVLRVIGPGAILLALSIGAGEWLLGPAALVKYGATILWIATGSIVLQALLNTEMARYTLYTGEPVFSGFMRTAPGPKFWGWVYTALHFLQVGWPGWALAAATAAAALFLGRLPHEGDRIMVLYLGYVTFLIAVLVVLVGETVGKTLEQVELFMTCWILGFLILTGLILIPSAAWLTVGAGFVAPLLGAPPLPATVDWFLLAGFAAYSGAGGTINAALTYWLRDKGFGMSATVAYAPAVVGGQKIQISHAGVVFPPSEDNLRKWRGWWRYLRADQWHIWAPGALIGMALPALIAVAFIEHGATLGGYGVAAHLGQALGVRYGAILWVLALVTGFWILFSTQLANAEGCA
ncbi:MAG: Nramp family divalent metal transporter, partial [Anaerolineae bacterium]